ncbi:MAG: hypothetical protein B7Y98_03230 [Sphingomonas sp. 32-62-10]|nr:MAG: hypothetical protein B7Z43_09200 [Sphingomonas sp. 12-62-6]OYX40094.1 MAG: hypothetical protein B7Y98_03230 [Sphingomonas sp. 32-62-10]OYY66414.1 MAG: hypothetical protein B7Y49_03110 [Sphingomonas sp. 28-62-11]
MLTAGCAKTGEVTLGGITAIRTACPAVAVPAATGDVTLFNPASSQEQSALDVSALMTNVRSTCSDVGENVQTVVTFDIRARRTSTQGARDVTLPYFITVVQGGTAVVAKRIGRVSVHFDDGQARGSVSGQATANVLRSAATLSPEIRKSLTRIRKAGAEDAAVDPLSRPEIRQAVQRASFEALVGFQLTDAQLKFNATR